MSPTYVGNPPWVDRVLNENWASIEAKVGSEWMPVYDTVKRKKHFQEYGCGHYGCVLPSANEGFVFKVTSDPTEAAFVVAANQIGQWPDGVVKYAFVYQTSDQYKKRPVYVLAREEAHDVGGWLKMSISRRAVNRLHAFKLWATIARDKIVRSKNIGATLAEVERLQEWSEDTVDWGDITDAHKSVFVPMGLKGAHAAAYAARAAQIIAMEMEQEDVGYLIGEALNFYIEQGILLADVHANNVGRVEDRGSRGSGLWVITDPGHMVALQTRWLDIKVPEL